MTETPIFFPGPRGRLFGVLHEARGTGSGEPFVLCHPLGEEKLWSHRVFVSFARLLAAAGHGVLRFDYAGNGDSDGEFADCSLASLRADVAAAAGEIRRRTSTETISMLGLRSGATIASLVAEELEVSRLILWAPVVDGARYMQDLLRINLSTQIAMFKEVRHDREALVAQMRGGQTVNVDGYELAFALYEGMSGVNLAANPKKFAGRCLIVPVDRNPGPPDAELQRLAATYANTTLAPAQEEPFWKEIARFYDQAPNLFAVTRAWMQ
jgi:exosortase A-associated hydrolase 2